jgi:hypothetical protein
MKNVIPGIYLLSITILSCKEPFRHQGQADYTPSLSPVFKININVSQGSRQDLDLSTIASEIEYIPLETAENCLLGNENNIALTDSFIFVSDPQKLLKFDRSGKFISQIGANGRGPGEYLYVYDIETDNEKGLVYLLSYPNLLIYRTNGRFIRSFRIKFKSAHFILTDQGQLVFYPVNLPSLRETRDFSWYVTDTLGNMVDSIPNYHKRVNYPGIWVDDAPMYIFNRNTYLIEVGSDSLFSLYPELHLAAVISLGDLKMDYDKSMSVEHRKEVLNGLAEHLRLGNIMENDNYIFLKLAWGYSDSVLCCVYDKHREKIRMLPEEGFRNDIDGGIRFWPDMMFKDSVMVVLRNSSFFLENKESIHKAVTGSVQNEQQMAKIMQLYKELDENSNPVAILFH